MPFEVAPVLGYCGTGYCIIVAAIVAPVVFFIMPGYVRAISNWLSCVVLFAMEAQQLALRQQARVAKSAQDARLVALHREAAAALAGPQARSVRETALAQVSRWEHGNRCSPHYIARWRAILALAPAAAAQAMLQADGEGPALRQNTPFGFLLRG